MGDSMHCDQHERAAFQWYRTGPTIAMPFVCAFPKSTHSGRFRLNNKLINRTLGCRLHREFGGMKRGIAIGQSRGGLIHALWDLIFLILYPINPKAFAKYRVSGSVSGAKDDPSDAALQTELICRHRERCRPWMPDSAEARMVRAERTSAQRSRTIRFRSQTGLRRCG